MSADATIDPALAARNRRQGLFWVAVVLLVSLMTAVKFWILGLPPDPRVAQVIEQRADAAAAAGAPVPSADTRLPEPTP
jgi:hypothetical protein